MSGMPFEQAVAILESCGGLSDESTPAGEALFVVLAEVGRLKADIACVVSKVAEGRLDGYRELGARAATAENERDSLLSEVKKLKTELSLVRGLPQITLDKSLGIQKSALAEAGRRVLKAFVTWDNSYNSSECNLSAQDEAWGVLTGALDDLREVLGDGWDVC